jgi:serine/threonine-protein kinase HipA
MVAGVIVSIAHMNSIIPLGVNFYRQDITPSLRQFYCIIKLTSDNFYLKHEESLVEFGCMTIAKQCGIDTAEFDLLSASNDRFWLRQDRFDCIHDAGRLHMISASGLLDASFREPTLDYVDLIKATRIMCGVDEAV